MTTYKVGDEVLVRARLVKRVGGSDWRIEVPHNAYTYRVRKSDIAGLAPKPEVDWSQVPMGARVRVRGKGDDWQKGRFVCFDAEDQEHPYHVLIDDQRLGALWFPICELVEEGDE